MDDDAPDDEALIDPEDLEGLTTASLEADDLDGPEVDDLEEPDFDDELVDELIDPDELGDADELAESELPDDLEVDDVPEPVRPATDEDDDDDDDDELDPDDVEASLDVILKDRLVIEEVEDDDEEAIDTDDRGEGAGAVVPKRPDEFVCQSCFLVKHPSQLADAAKQLCRDCV